MADSLSEWLYGTPEQDAADWQANMAQYRKARSSPDYEAMRGMEPFYSPSQGRMVDPRAARMDMVADTLVPASTSDAIDAEKLAFDYVTQAGQRVRDTALRGAQELAKGNFGNALGHSVRAPLAAFVPPMAAGIPGAPDDWRPIARKAGVPDSHIMAFDFGTDPENWMAAPVKGPAAFVIPAVQAKMAMGVASRADDVLGAISKMRRGAGVPTELVDEYGNVIRQLRNSPRVPQLRIGYGRP